MSNNNGSIKDSDVLVLLSDRGLDGLARVRNFLSNQGLDIKFWEAHMLSYFAPSQAPEGFEGSCRGYTARVYVLVEGRFDAIVEHKSDLVPRHQQIAMSSRVIHTEETAAILRYVGLKRDKASYGLQAVLLAYFVKMLEEDLDLVKLLNGHIGARKFDYDFIREARQEEEARAAQLSGDLSILWSSGLGAEA